MADNPILRAIILNYNQAEVTIECVSSVLAQKYLWLQIVVVDNGSSVIEYTRLKENLPERVVLLRSDTNVGYAAGNNLACSLPNLPVPDFIMILNNDTIVKEHDVLEKLVNSFSRAGDQCAVVAPLVDTLSTKTNVYNQIQGRKLLSTFKMVVANSAILSRIGPGKKISEEYLYKSDMPLQKGNLYEVDCVSGAAFVIRSTFLENDKIFDEQTFLYFEEIILAEKLASKRGRSFINSDVIVSHYHGKSTGKRGKSQSYKMFIYGLSSELYFYKKYRKLSPVALNCIKALKHFEYHLKKVLY
jgi:GT2 family glycosyltransferase